MKLGPEKSGHPVVADSAAGVVVVVAEAAGTAIAVKPTFIRRPPFREGRWFFLCTGLKILAWVENSSRVEGTFDGVMEVPQLLGGSYGPPGFLGQANAVFASDRPLPRDDLLK